MKKIDIPKESCLIKGAIWNTAGSLAYGLNSFLMLAVAGRIGSVEDVGTFGIAFTTAQLLYIVGVFGANHFQQTDFQEEYGFSEYRKAKFFSSLLTVFACALSIVFLRFSGIKLLYTILLTSLMITNSIGEMYQSRFFQKKRLDLSGKTLFFRTTISLMAFIIVSFVSRNIITGLIFQIAVNLFVTYFMAYYFINKYQIKSERSTNSSYQSLIKACFPLLISVFFMNVLISIPKYGVEYLMDDTAQGYFSMVFIIAQGINLISQFIFKPLLYRYSDLLNRNESKLFWRAFGKQILFILSVTLAISIVAYVIGPSVLGFIYGKDLHGYGITMAYIVLGGGAMAVSNLFYYIYVVLRKQKTIMIIYLVGITISLISTYLLIKGYGINGAAIAFGMGEMVTILFYYGILRKRLMHP